MVLDGDTIVGETQRQLTALPHQMRTASVNTTYISSLHIKGFYIVLQTIVFEFNY